MQHCGKQGWQKFWHGTPGKHGCCGGKGGLNHGLFQSFPQPQLCFGGDGGQPQGFLWKSKHSPST